MRHACSLFRAPVLYAALLLGAPLLSQASLPDYVARPEPDFSWKKESDVRQGTLRIVTLKMRSQVWRGIPWDHSIQVFLPEQVKYPKNALLLVTGGSPGPSSVLLASLAVPQLQGPVAILYDIPNQPLLGGKREDDLIAHTFQEYLESGDATWPLLFPMVKSAVRAMDAVQAYSKAEMAQPIEGFVVTGASKRGWTTYLTGAVDPRVKGIAPMVFDNLNFNAQMPRQLELWGRYSEQIEDYTRRGLQQKMATERGQKLVAMVDPWHYRQKLAMPKLLIHGANDRYWATDATRLYWNDLPGPKHLLSVPNAGHGINDQVRVINSLAAFFRAVSTGTSLPGLELSSRTDGPVLHIAVKPQGAPTEVRLWMARAENFDFRPAKWEATVLTGKDGSYEAKLDLPANGGLAVYAEAAHGPEQPFTVTTSPEVIGKPKAAAP